MRNPLTIISQQGVRSLGQKTEKTCIVFSNGAPIHNCGLWTFRFQKCGGKINAEGRVLGFTPLGLYKHFLLKRILKMRATCAFRITHF